MKAIRILVIKFWPAIVALTVLIMVSCEDQYTEAKEDLTSQNFFLHYPDTTTNVKWAVNSAISVVKPDSFKIPDNYKIGVNYSYRLQLDTLTGIDTGKVAVSYKALAGLVKVDAKTGLIKLDNSKKNFKPGDYKLYIMLVTLNGPKKFRDKVINVNIRL